MDCDGERGVEWDGMGWDGLGWGKRGRMGWDERSNRIGWDVIG